MFTPRTLQRKLSRHDRVTGARRNGQVVIGRHSATGTKATRLRDWKQSPLFVTPHNRPHVRYWPKADMPKNAIDVAIGE